MVSNHAQLVNQPETTGPCMKPNKTRQQIKAHVIDLDIATT